MAPTPAQVVQNKPVAVVGGVTTVAAGVTAWLVAKGYVPADAAPYAIGVLVALATLIIHALVSPYAKVKQVLEQGLHISDADFGRLEVVLEQYGLQLVTKPQLAPPPAVPQHAAIEVPIIPPAPQG